MRSLFHVKTPAGKRLACMAIAAAVAGSGCTKPDAKLAEDPVVEPAPSARAPATPAAASSPTTAASAPAGAVACGELDCLQFEDPESAFRYLLDKRPAILAIGEAHAQKRKEGTASAAKRFTDSLLPFCKGRASDLVLELMAPNDKCAKKTEAVREQQREVTRHQAATNQNEYVAMGERARALGIVPDLLRPSCEDLSSIQKAGDGAVPLTLETIARLTRAKVEQLVDRNVKTPEDAGKMVLTYGGILHNDLAPSEGRAAWSFGPALAQHVKGDYIELDLFVPEFIEDTEIWRRLPWYAHYDKAKLGDKATLFRVGDNSYALVFAVSE